MSKSSYSNIHPVDQILTSLVAEAIPSDSTLIADQVFETVTVPERSGTILIEESRNFTGAGAGLDLERAPGASRATIGGFDRSSTTFKCRIYGAEDSIAMEDILDSQFPGSEEQRIALKVRRVLQLAREKRAADLLFGTANFADNNATAEFGGQFDAVGSTPLSDLQDLKNTVYESAHGVHPDTLILGHKVFRTLAKNPEVRGYLEVGGTNTIGVAAGSRILNMDATLQVLRDVLGIQNVFVGSARRDNSVPGKASDEQYIWTQDSMFMGILKGSDAITQKSGNVKGMPVAALNLSFGDMIAGQYDSLDRTRRYVYAEESHIYKAIDSTLGKIITAVVN